MLKNQPYDVFRGNPLLFIKTLRYGRMNNWQMPNGYNFAFLDQHGYAVCPKCVEKNLYGVLLSFAHAYRYPKTEKYHHYLLGTFTNQEGYQVCNWCDAAIPCNRPTCPSWRETWNHTQF
jgi:hypothetical protein